jgi:hypothetical protein
LLGRSTFSTLSPFPGADFVVSAFVVVLGGAAVAVARGVPDSCVAAAGALHAARQKQAIHREFMRAIW